MKRELHVDIGPISDNYTRVRRFFEIHGLWYAFYFYPIYIDRYGYERRKKSIVCCFKGTRNDMRRAIRELKKQVWITRLIHDIQSR
jgi:hypothetical protein